MPEVVEHRVGAKIGFRHDGLRRPLRRPAFKGPFVASALPQYLAIENHATIRELTESKITMPLRSSGPDGWVSFAIGVKLVMLDERDKTVLIAIDSDVLDFFESPIPDDDVACFKRHRGKIERVASALYDAGLVEDGGVRVTYGDLRRL
jgi:hypothetical protein